MKVGSEAEENITTSSLASLGSLASIPSYLREHLYSGQMAGRIQQNQVRIFNDHPSNSIYPCSSERTSTNDVINTLSTPIQLHDMNKDDDQQLELLSDYLPATAGSVRRHSKEEQFSKHVPQNTLLPKSPVSRQPNASITTNGPAVSNQSPMGHSCDQDSPVQADNRVQNQVIYAFKCDIPSPEFMYRFPGASGLYVGFEDKVRPGTVQLENWSQKIEPRLLTDIKEFQKKMMKSSKVRWGRSGPLISPQLRMSGHSVTGTATVTLLPCVWILYDKAKWKRDVQRFVKELEWLACEGFGEIEVHKGANLAALDSPSFVSGLDLDETRALHLEDGTSLYLHLESPQGISACGLICCATLTSHGTVVDQRLSRMGGLLSINGENFGAITAHGLMECLWDRKSEIMDSSNESYALESIGSEESDSEMSQDQNEEEECVELLGGIDAFSITGWDHSFTTGVSGFLDTHACDLKSFVQQIQRSPKLPPEFEMGENTNGIFASSANPNAGLRGSDFVLLRNENMDGLKNTYTMKDLGTIEVDTVFTWDDASAGPVQLLFGHDQVLDGILIPGPTSLVMHGFEFKSRKIRTPAPLAQGCSGSWVVRGRHLCGVIIASYEAEPYVHIVTSYDLLLDISTWSCEGSSVSLPAEDAMACEKHASDTRQIKGKTVPSPRSYVTKITDGGTKQALSDLGTRPTQLLRPGLEALHMATMAATEPADLYRWQNRFQLSIHHPDENQGHANVSATELQELISENTPYIDPETIRNETEDLVHCFITKYGTEKRHNAKAEYLSSFIETDIPLAFLFHRSRLPSRIVARIDDRKSNRDKISYSKDYGNLNVEEFYLTLSKKRFQCPEEHSTDRRLITITDPDQYSMVALMLTASKSQTSALGKVFYQHVALRPHIGTDMMCQSSGTFSFSVCLPFYSWQCGKKAPVDHRRKADGTPLRQVQKYSTHPMNDQEDYLCASQISILVTGIDGRAWTGYCLVDTYYQPESTSQSHDEDEDLLHGIQTDPVDNGICLPDTSVLDPREYFLLCFERQAGIFLDEWNYTIERLYHQFQAYVREEYYYSLGRDSVEVERLLDFLPSTRRALDVLIPCLESTIECWDHFEPEKCFQTTAGQQALSSIQEVFWKLRKCLKGLIDMKEHAEGREEYMLSRTIQGQIRVSLRRAETYLGVKTIISLPLYLLSPAALVAVLAAVIRATVLLSMEGKATPSFWLNGPPFFVLVFFLTSIVVLMSKIVQHWGSIQLLETLWQNNVDNRISTVDHEDIKPGG